MDTDEIGGWRGFREQQPGAVGVGLGVIIVREGRVLVGRRRGAHGEGYYSFPGGHLEYGEEWAACAEREVEEETGLIVKVRPFDDRRLEVFVTNNVMREDSRHYITIYLVADYISGEPQCREPDRCDGWQWMTWDELTACLPSAALHASQAGTDHPALHWIPIKDLFAYRADLGL